MKVTNNLIDMLLYYYNCYIPIEKLWGSGLQTKYRHYESI